MPKLPLQGPNRTGIDPLEHEHLRLLELIEATCAQVTRDDGSEPVLDALGLLYVRICAHFALEEKLLRERTPELYAAHKLKYEALLDRLRVMMDAFEDGQCDFCDKSLNDCLRSLLAQHFQEGQRQPGASAAMLCARAPI